MCVFPICEKVGGPPYALTPALVRSLLEPAGFKRCEDVAIDQAEWHRPGGAGSLGAGAGGPGTALLLARM